MCLNGFLPVVSKAYDTDIISSVKWQGSLTSSYVRKQNSVLGYAYISENVDDNEVYSLNNASYASMDELWIGDTKSYFDLLYMPDLYDYYLIGSVYGNASSASEFSFYPNEVRITSYMCDENAVVTLENLKVYHHDMVGTIGFTFSCKIPQVEDTMISYVRFKSNVLKSVPAKLKCKMYIVRVEKSNTGDVDALIAEKLDAINNSINNQGSNISESIEHAMNEINNAIENQYSVSEKENFGVEDIIDQVNEKAGVLSFGTDTLVNFLDLFDAANATNTKLTFPGFSMEIQGVDYQVWPDYHYDLSELENQFGALIEFVRWSCVMVVWLAVLNYLVKAYDAIFGR